MAERVAFLCSNPKCKASTIGPNTQADKSTKVGEAAHITAASIGGPRYDNTLTIQERSHIDNGIWLCSKCADLIDKDEKAYPVPLLKKWKTGAEYEAHKRISGMVAKTEIGAVPFIEADLEWQSSGRRHLNYSDKNPTEIDEKTGRLVMPIYFDGSTISIWQLDWEYSLNIYNNSSQPAYNLRIEEVSENKFSKLQSLEKINSLKPFDVLKLQAFYKPPRVEAKSHEADEMLKPKIPKELDGLELQIVYQDEARKQHRTIVKIEGQEITNTKL
jgi:hypothetical protein